MLNRPAVNFISIQRSVLGRNNKQDRMQLFLRVSKTAKSNDIFYRKQTTGEKPNIKCLSSHHPFSICTLTISRVSWQTNAEN